MKTKILIIMLCISQLVSGQFGDKLLKDRMSKSAIQNGTNEIIREFGACEGACFGSVVFNPSMDTRTFRVSHGSPSFSTNGIWMWSYKNRNGTIMGEGIFTQFQFVKGRQYCMEVEVELSRTGSSESIDPSATFNFDATNTVTSNPSGSGGGPLPSVSPRQSLISGNYSNGGYPFNSTFRIRKTFTANDNYSQLWIYPKNPGRPHPQLNMRVRKVVIKEAVSCPCEIDGNIRFKKRENCEYQFFANASGTNSSTRVTGYLWEFGDGTTSTDQNPIHIFPNQGTYYVKLTILGINDDGECCTKTITTRVSIREKCPQICEIQANFKVVKKGWWFSRSCDFINTSKSNVVTNIVGYEWYIDGVLVSTDKDIKNYKGRGKKVCLKVYGIDRNGNCCQDEYCFNLRR
jgi:PKD repeat protein